MLLCVGVVFAFPSVSFAKKPLVANVSILGAVIAPTRWTGAPWDGPAKRNPKTVAAVRKLMKGAAPAEVIRGAGKLAPKGKAAPDVFGYVAVYGPTTRKLAHMAATRFALATMRDAKHNTYTPQFNVSYNGWPVYKHTQFRLVLWDADHSVNEQIGVVNVSYRDVANAVAAGKPVWVNVYRRSQTQILYVRIRASKAAPDAAAKVDGQKFQ